MNPSTKRVWFAEQVGAIGHVILAHPLPCLVRTSWHTCYVMFFPLPVFRSGHVGWNGRGTPGDAADVFAAKLPSTFADFDTLFSATEASLQMQGVVMF